MKKSKGYAQSYAGDADVLYGGDENQYLQTKKEKASPYNLSYLAAWNLRPRFEDPFVPVAPRQGEPKRSFVLVLIAVMMVLLIAALALSYLAVMPEYTALFQKPAISGTDIEEEEADEEAEVDEEAEDIEGDITISLDDIINSTLRKLAIGAADVETADLHFYTDCLENIDELETPYMIAYYALPVSMVLTAVIAIYVLIKAISGIAGRMKRKKFTYIILLQLLFSLFGVVSGFVWSGVAVADIMSYITGSSLLVLGIGYLALLGIEVVALVLSLFAYKSKAQISKEAQAKADEINRRNLAAYNRRLGPNSIIVGD